MNVLQTLQQAINGIPALPMQAKLGFLQAGESFCVYPTKNGSVIDEDFAGNQEMRLYYEVGVRTKDQELGNQIMWLVSDLVRGLISLGVDSNNWRFQSIEATSEPAISQADTQGFFVYAFDCAVNITTNKYRS